MRLFQSDFLPACFIEVQKLFLTSKVNPVISRLVTKIAAQQPTAVVDFICAELKAKESGSDTGKITRWL